MVIAAAAHAGPHAVSIHPLNSVHATVAVFALVEVKTRANRNSFQLNMMQNRAVTIRPGILKGKTIFRNVPHLEHPSTRAASSISAGISSKNPYRGRPATLCSMPELNIAFLRLLS
jgi:hypothetical protein